MEKVLLILILFISIHLNTNAQTVLMPGDVAIVHYQADTPDQFAFITFVDLSAGTTIYFTDCGTINGGSFLSPCTEGAQVYVAPALIPTGTVIEWPGGNFSSHTDSRITGSLSLGTAGDQIIIFQDTDGAGGSDPGQNPSFIFAFNAASTQFTGNPNSSSTQTGMPQGLAGIPNASLAVGSGSGVSDENDNSAFNTSLAPFASLAAAQAAILDPANWSPSQSITTEPYATYASNVGSTTFVSGCTEPDVPSSFNSAPSTICDGDFALLSWAGALNDATAWHIYSGSCGGTLVTVVNSNSAIVTPPSAGETYYIRGEGGCASPGTCASLFVSVTPNEDASFNYSSATYFANETDPSPMITGVGGGTFSAPGLVINTSTGEIDLDASPTGTYTVTYTTPGLCSGNANQMVTINDPAVATAAAGCNSFGVAASGSAWIDIVDGGGNLVASVNPNGANLGFVIVEMDDRASVGQDNLSEYYLPRYFNFTSTNFDGVGSPFPAAVSLRLYYKGAELSDYNTAAGTALTMSGLILSHYSGANEDCDITNNENPTVASITDLTPSASVYNGTDFYLEVNVPHFSEFGAGAGGVGLPVELLSFKGRTVGQANELSWSTASEEAFSHFEVERSFDGSSFRNLGEVRGSGNTANVSEYAYIDRDNLGSRNYYRLKMIDLDGSFEYSHLVLLKNQTLGNISISPNPSKSTIKVQFQNVLDSEVNFTILDVSGKIAMQGILNDTNSNLDINSLVAGLYILQVKGGNINDSVKLIKE